MFNHLLNVICMKSIMEQASTVEKAVSKAWERSNYPASFSIKILEHPEKNFFGLTTKPAKIALFYTEQETKERAIKPKPVRKRKEPELPSEPPIKKTVRSTGRNVQAEWSPGMIDAAQSWLEHVLTMLNKKDASFSTLKKNSHLVFLFDKPFFDSIEKERLLFSSFALLLLKSLRIKFKNTKNLKVVFQQKA